MTTEELRKELLSHAVDGVLRVEAVVEAARSTESPLHTWFEWDDTKAANEYRLEQARRLIRRVLVFVEFNGSEVPVRAFISLAKDRKEDGGGYRTTVSVMADKDLRHSALSEALDDMVRFERKYRHLSDLAGVLASMEQAKKKILAKREHSPVAARVAP